MDRKKVIKALECCLKESDHLFSNPCNGCPYEGQECIDRMKAEALALLKEMEEERLEWIGAVAKLTAENELLKEQEVVEPKTIPTELKQKMWNALYAEEDEYEKKFVGKEEHLNWFTVYRPWLQKGFDIAINAIAEWEGR